MKIALCLYGYFNNRRYGNAGDKGYEYIKANILDKVGGDIDVFTHTWEVDLEKKIEDLYSPQVRQCEKQIDFNSIAKESGIDEGWINEGYNRKGTIYQ